MADFLDSDDFRSALQRGESWAQDMFTQLKGEEEAQPEYEQQPAQAEIPKPIEGDFLSQAESKRFEAYAAAKKVVMSKLCYDPVEKYEMLKRQEMNGEGSKSERMKLTKPEVVKSRAMPMRADFKPRQPPERLPIEPSGVRIEEELVEGGIITEEEKQDIEQNDAGLGVRIDDDHIITKCMNCPILLKTKKMASLVYCPACETISPNYWM